MSDGDPIQNPPHYTRLDPQPLDVIESWGLEHHEACSVKYVARAGFKPLSTRAEDLRKAAQYLVRKARILEAEEALKHSDSNWSSEAAQ